MRKVNGVDCALSSLRSHCRACRRPQGQEHQEGCELGTRAEVAHVHQYRGGLYYGPHFSALPSEWEEWQRRPWWKRTRRKTERHFLRREQELRAERERDLEERRRRGETVPRPFPGAEQATEPVAIRR